MANRPSQLLCVVPLPASAVFLQHPAPHTSGREESWRCLAFSQSRGAMASSLSCAWPALGGDAGALVRPASQQTSSFLPTQPDQTAFRKQSGVHISTGCRRRKSSVVGRGELCFQHIPIDNSWDGSTLSSCLRRGPTASPCSVESFVLARDEFLELSCAQVSHRDFPFAHGM